MSDRRHVAAVDLGSHTFAVVIARADGARAGFRAIDVLKERVALTQGLEDDGSVATGTVDRALAELPQIYGDIDVSFSPATVAVLDCTHHAMTRRGLARARSTTGRTGIPSPNIHNQSRIERTTR